jgi:hypothetical protein
MEAERKADQAKAEADRKIDKEERRAAAPEEREETRDQYGRMERKTATTTGKERI